MTVSSISELKQWLTSNKISEVECIFPDMAGSSKGKILPVQRFIKSIEDQSLKLADSVFGQTVSGKWVYESEVIDYVEEDLFMSPDITTLRKIPWNREPTAQIICDLKYANNEPSEIAPRQVLINVIDQLNDLVGLDLKPDLTFLLNAPIPICFDRLKKRIKSDRFDTEKADFFEAVRDSYLNRAKVEPERFILIDCDKEFKIVCQNVLEQLVKRMT